MGGLDPAKILVILIIALIVLGPDRLPTAARQLGGAWRELNRLREKFEEEVRAAVPDLDLPKIPTSPVPGRERVPERARVRSWPTPTAASATTGVNGAVTESLEDGPGVNLGAGGSGVWSDDRRAGGRAGRVAAPARTAGNRGRRSTPHSVGALVVVPRLAVGRHGVHARRAEHELNHGCAGEDCKASLP